jgi:hypothetical protein
MPFPIGMMTGLKIGMMTSGMASGGLQIVPPVAIATVVIICVGRGMYEFSKMNNELRMIENNSKKNTEPLKFHKCDIKNNTKDKKKVRCTTKCVATASAIDTTYNIDFGELADEFIAEYINE